MSFNQTIVWWQKEGEREHENKQEGGRAQESECEDTKSET